jgi:hypothetical protein
MRITTTTYLQFIQPLDEWREYKRSGQRTRLALYACTYNGPDCKGQTKQVPSDVRNTKVVSCGCYKKQACKVDPHRRADYAKKTIGRFQILHLIGIKGAIGHQLSIWRAICLACGKEVDISSTNIRKDYSECRCRFKRSNDRKNWERRVQERIRDAELTTLLQEIAHHAGDA